MSNKVLAFDFGGSSGRALIGQIVNGKLIYKEISRFENKPKMIDNVFSWDIDDLYNNVINTIKIASVEGFDAIGIDTWGVDYGLINKDNKLIKAPAHYRDGRTEKTFEEIHKIISENEYYKLSGISPMRINTIYQLYADKDIINSGKVDKFLLMPDLFAFMLTGQKKCEYSIASTTGLLNHNSKSWNYQLIEKLGISKEVFPNIINSGETYGELTDEICALCKTKKVPVIAVCGHDTASAIMATPTAENAMYISCGTWSLMGVVTDDADYTDIKYSNECGFDKKVTYLKNIMGLWLAQEVKRNLKESGENLSFAELDALMESTKSIETIINTNDEMFVLPENMIDAIKSYAIKTYQIEPKNIGEVMHIIYNSLAEEYTKTYLELCEKQKNKFSKIFLIGGGSKSFSLCQRLADKAKVMVFSGPAEATALGNILLQLLAVGEIKNKNEIVKLIMATEKIDIFEPIDK